VIRGTSGPVDLTPKPVSASRVTLSIQMQVTDANIAGNVLGDVLTLKASVNQAFNSSMEVGVRVEAESFVTGRTTHTSSAYLVFVAIDDTGKPRAVPPLVAETEEEKLRQREAVLRREARLARKQAIEGAREAT
jgi:hypothetical protein